MERDVKRGRLAAAGLPQRLFVVLVLVFISAFEAYGAPKVDIDLSSERAREATAAALAREANARKLDASVMAVRKGWARRGKTAKGQVFELMALKSDGSPVYYQTQNGSAAISTAANLVRNAAPYNVSGTNLIVGIWDGGAVRSDHQEFTSPSRVEIKDGCSADDHATHVGGTIGAKGVDSNAEGMAPKVGIHSYDWNSDQSEMSSEAATAQNQTNKVYVSNHSYGYVCGWETGSYSGNYGPHWFGYQLSDREDRGFGQYSSDVRSWDAICYDAPYYLPFKAAGNDRNDTAPADGTTFYYYSGGSWASKSYSSASDPYSDNYKSGGYDTIGYIGVAKNVMTVGAVNDAVDSGSRNTANATMASFSCWGPTDDGRIKPDIVADGVYVYSSLADSTTSYGYMSGTSMATPNAAGSAMLIMDYYRSLYPNGYMRASMLKALIIHTADDLGTAGPDYQNGWGLMNTKAACDAISNHYAAGGAGLLIDDAVNTSTTSNTYTFTWDNSSPIRVTLCWTDPEGTAQSGLNTTTANLVNDLDLRIVGPDGTTNFPYKLDRTNPGNAATQADNTLDNVEQVYIADPSGQGGSNFTVVVNYKGSLTDNSQTYSLVFSNVEVDESPNYGLRDDAGVNVPTVTYWCTGLGGDAVKKGTEFDGTDLGSISALYIKDAAIKTWKSGIGDVSGTTFKYKLWVDGTTEPTSYTARAVGWTSDDGSGNQTWSDFGTEINATNGLSVGDYNWKILFEVSGSGTPGLSANGPWVATFTITPNYGNSWHIPANSEPSAMTMRAPTSPSSDQDVTFNVGTYSPDSDQSGGTLYYREAGGSWQTKALGWNTQEGDNKFWKATITGNTFTAGTSVEYCFKVEYTDDDDTYLGTTNNTGSTKFAGETAAKAAPFTFTYSSAANISVLGTNLAEIADGDASPSTADGTDFGGVDVTGPVVTNVFTITNTGSATLNLEDVAIGGTHAADFAVTQPDEAWIEAGSSRTFTLTFDPSASGTRSATVYITNDTSGAESEYTFAIQGGGLADPAAATATADGNELIDLAWTKDANCDVMIVHRAGSASTAPVQGTAYSVGDACGSGTVIYKGSGAALEHVAASGQTHHYAFYSYVGNYYSDGLTDSATLGSYAAGSIVDAFAYTNGVTMDTVSSSGGNGFSGGWAGNTSDFTVHDGSFATQANYPAPHGNKVTCTAPINSSTSMRRSFGAISTGRVYAAYVMNYQWDGANKWSGASLLDDTTEKVFFGECYGGNALLGVGDTVSGTAMSAGLGNDYIVITRYDFDTGTAVASAYKIGTDTVPLSEPGSWDVTDSSMGTIAEIDGILLHGGAGATDGTPGDLYFDEVRVATSWKELIQAAPDAPAVQAATATNTTSFTAAWSVSMTATNYLLDVSSASDFSSFVSGYEERIVGSGSSESVSGLSEATTYYYRLRAQNAFGMSGYSDTQSVTTVSGTTVPVLDSPTVASITQSGATLGATITTNGGAALSERGTVWGTSSSPTGNSLAEGGTATGTFSHARSGLSAGTHYYYRGYAINSAGTGYSADGEFWTIPPDPSSAAASATNETDFTAAWASATGATNYLLDVSTASDFSGFVGGYENRVAGNVTSCSVTGLTDGTEYFYRLRAQNSGGISGYSDTQSVTTVTTPPNYGLRDDAGVNLPTLTYDTGSGAATEKAYTFDSAAFGDVTAFTVSDASILTWKSGAGNVTGTKFLYKVWADGDAEPGSYTERAVGWTSDDGGGNQTWSDFGASIDLVNGLGFDDYHVKVMCTVQGSGSPGVLTNGPFEATFTLIADMGNAWHVPANAEPDGVYMRDPQNAYANDDVYIYNGNQYQGGGTTGDQSGGTLYFRLVGDVSWESTNLSYYTTVDNNKYWRSVITGETFVATNEVEYYLKVTYTDRDDTYIGTTNSGTSSVTLSSASQAQSNPFSFAYGSTPGEEAGFISHASNVVKQGDSAAQFWVKVGYAEGSGSNRWVDNVVLYYTTNGTSPNITGKGTVGADTFAQVMSFDHMEDDTYENGDAMWWAVSLTNLPTGPSSVIKYKIGAWNSSYSHAQRFADYQAGTDDKEYSYSLYVAGASALEVSIDGGSTWLNADYTTSKAFIDEIAGDGVEVQVRYNPGVGGIKNVEVFSNVGRRDYVTVDYTNVNITADGYPDGIKPPDGNLLTTNDVGAYFRAHPMVWDGSSYFEWSTNVGKCGAYRLTARYQTSEQSGTNWTWYSSGGVRDHAIVVSPTKAHDLTMYELNPLTVKATDTNSAGRSTFADLLEGNQDSFTNFNLGYLNKMHINCLWFQPIHPSAETTRGDPSGYEPGSPYATRDYFAVSKWFGDAGTEADALAEFTNFVADADSNSGDAGSINVMLDGVFNHTAWDAVMGQGGVDLGYASSASDSMPGTRPSWYSYYNDYGLPATYYDDVYTNDIAVAPDRGDFGKWDDTADVFYGRYSALVRQNPDDNSDYLNEDDQYEYSAMTTNTMDLWKYFGHYVKFWLEKTGHSLTNAYDLEQDNRGIDGLRCDFGQGLPPQFWEYFINYARSMKWNFVFMAETLDGGVPGYRSNRHFDILNESILFTFNNSSADASTFKSALESRRSSYNGGTILLNQSSHDETMPSADAWRTASFYGAINAVDGVPMLFSGQEWGIQPSSGEFGGANQGYALYESNFGKWIPHFKQWNKATFWETHPANSAGLAQWHGYVNRARLGSPALRSLNRYFLNDMAGNYDNGIFSVAKYENAYGSPSTSDVVLAFAVILGDPHAEDSQTYDVDPCFDLLGLDTGTYYNVRNLAAADTNSYLWETARSGQDLRDNGIYIAFTAGVSGNITNDGALVQYLKVCIISPPDAPTVNPASATNDTHFTASWNTSDTATNYVLDVSAASDFGSFVGGFEALDVGDVTSASVTGLTADTTYYYRLRAQNVAGLSGYSATQAVTTILVVTTPTIDTPTQADITCTTATLGATLQDNGNATVTNYGIVWATSETPTLADNVVQESTTEPSMPDVFTVPVTGLPDGTTIYYRGYAMNTNGTGYSTVDSFTTLTLPQGANPDSANATTAYIGDTVTINAKSWQNWETVNARSYAQIHGRWDNADLTSGTTTGAGRDPGSSTDELYANTPQFTQAGTFYWAMMISYQEGNDFYYWQDSASWHKLSESLPDTAAQSITVSVIPVPSDQTATRSVSSPDSAIDLGWRRNSAPHDVLIVRKTAAQSWTEPAAGVTYNADDSIGDGIVVYRGSATNLSDTGLTSGTTYDYKFYSENYSYYSAGVTAQAGTRGAVSAVWDGETSGIMTLGANWNPNGAPATGTDVNLYFNSGVTCYNVTNDYTADEDFGGIFFNSDTAYTLTGNAFQLYEKLENSNTAAVTVSADITLNGATKTEINPVGGDITLAGAVDTAGKNLEVYGSNSKVLQINGAVTGSGDLYVKQKSLVKMSSASDYGDTYVEAGEFWINEGGSAGSASDTITVGGSDTNVIAKLWIADMDGGTTVSQQLAVTSGTGTNRMIGGLHTAGTNAYSGDISVTDAMELYTVAGGTLNVGGTISGSGAEVAKSGEGKLRLTGASTFTGPLYINAGTALVVNAGNPLQAAEVILGSAFNSWNTALQIGDGTTLTNRIVLRESSGGQGTQTIENVSGDAVAAGELRIEYAPTTPGKELILNGAGSSLDFSGGWNLCGTQRGVRVLGNVEVSGALTNGFTDGNQYRGLVKRGSGTLKLDGILGVRFYQDEGDVIVGSNCTFSGVDTYYLGTRDNDDYTAGDTFLTFRDAQTFSNGIVVGTLGAAPGTRQINFQNTQGLVKVSGAIVLGTNLNQYLVLSNDTANAELSGDISGSGGLIKQGAGTITFSANATYASKTTVSEGELLLNTITNTADVEVNTGARLVGRGAVGNLDVTGQIGPGTTNLVGTLSCTNLLMHDGATLDISMSSAGSSKLALLDGGDVTFDEGSTITVVLTNYGGGSLFQDMVILDYTGGSSFGNPNWVLTGEIPEAMEPYVSITNEGHSYWYIKGANPDCSISNGLTTVADGDEVHITAETVSGMEYDLIYVDAANYSDSLSNQWQFAQTLTAASSTTLFTNSLAGLAAGNHRFFRISPLGAWSNDYGKYASAEIFVAKKITLYPGRNWVAMPCLPPSATMSNVFGYQLPAAGSQLSATTIYLYSNGSSMTATNTLWHQTGNHWIESGQPADNKSLSSVQGMVVDLPGSETHTFTLIGALRTNTQSFVIQGGGAMSFVGAVLPAAMHPKDLGLLASGFTGGSRAMRSDRLYLWNRSAQRVNASGWMWYNTSLSKWCYDDGSVLSDSARPCGSDDALLICTEASAEDWTWNIPVFYTSPTTDMAP